MGSAGFFHTQNFNCSFFIKEKYVNRKRQSEAEVKLHGKFGRGPGGKSADGHWKWPRSAPPSHARLPGPLTSRSPGHPAGGWLGKPARQMGTTPPAKKAGRFPGGTRPGDAREAHRRPSLGAQMRPERAAEKPQPRVT